MRQLNRNVVRSAVCGAAVLTLATSPLGAQARRMAATKAPNRQLAAVTMRVPPALTAPLPAGPWEGSLQLWGTQSSTWTKNILLTWANPCPDSPPAGCGYNAPIIPVALRWAADPNAVARGAGNYYFVNATQLSPPPSGGQWCNGVNYWASGTHTQVDPAPNLKAGMTLVCQYTIEVVEGAGQQVHRTTQPVTVSIQVTQGSHD